MGPLARAPSSGGVNVQVEPVEWDEEKLRPELGSGYDFVIALPVAEDVGFATHIPPELCPHLLQKTVSETDNEQELVEWCYISASQLCQRECNEAISNTQRCSKRGIRRFKLASGPKHQHESGTTSMNYQRLSALF